MGGHLNQLSRPTKAETGMEEVNTENNLSKCSQDTAYRDILDLIERNALQKQDPGGGRSTSYSLVPAIMGV
ncbi:MAG: hypothetical protein ABW152_13060 [Candidatus Thiodiazotropha endolucinida]